MDLGDDHAASLFLEVYGTLPRAGPGGDEHTARALAAVPGPAPRTVLDLGCGPGAQTACLAAALPGAQILAVDVVPEMVATADRRLLAAGVQDRAIARHGDMAAPPVAPASQDLIWCEGAIYFLGITQALRTWRPLLTPGGTVVFSEPVWLTESPPPEIRTWWESEYPAITDDAGVRSRIGDASFRTIASFPLPPSAWWDEYYEPMQSRIESLRSRLPGDPVAEEIAAAADTEIAHFRHYSSYYSYAFFVVQPTD